ncbi:hypothetical protein ACLOJK_000734 [Asimina triloba]
MAHYATILPLLLLLHFLLQMPAMGSATSTKVPAIIVFGDSSVDTGNNNQISTIAKSNFEPYGRDFIGGKPTGRFCNGRVATDFISQALGLNPAIPAYLDPSITIRDSAQGVCFASAATGFDNATSDVLNVIPLWKQLEYFKEYQRKLRGYLGVEAAETRLREAVYIISLGTNDFVENYYNRYARDGGRAREYSIGAYQDFLIGIAEGFTRQLYEAGGRKISLGGIPPMGCMPLERSTNLADGGACIEEYNRVARQFNAKLRALAARLRSSPQLPGILTVFTNVYDTVLQAIEKPSQFGFENVAEGCCATGMFEMGYLCNRLNPFTCTDANKYVFWDSFHPTQRMHEIVAAHAMNTSLAEFL